jgi:predicted dehydrogenase
LIGRVHNDIGDLVPQPLVPSDSLILIAGFGSIGRRHFQNLRSLGFERFAFYRTHRGTVPADQSVDWPSFDNLGAALALQPKIAIVSNPSARHLEVATAAAEAGCDLFIEKPLSNSVDGYDELARVVRERVRVAMVGCQFRFHPLLIELRNGVESQRLGQVVGANAEWGEYLPDWHPWEDYRQSYSARAELGGGVVLTLIHPLDYLYWLFGRVERVQAATRAVPKLETPASEDWAEITLTFGSGVIAQVHLDYLQRLPVHRLRVWGDRGSATLDFQSNVLRWLTHGEKDETTEVAAPQGFERNTMFLDEMRHFLQCVAERQQPRIPLEDGIEVLRIALNAKQAAKGEPVHA